MAVIYGTDPHSGRRNQIEGNDFSEAILSGNIGLRGGFPIDSQVWPQDYSPVHSP
jgi:hypothetical protein